MNGTDTGYGTAPDGWREAFEEQLLALLGRVDAPGIGVTLFGAGNVLLEAGYGLRDREERLPVDADTIFGIASITKSFTALSVLLLVSDGQLSLDDPITDHLPFTLWEGREPARVRHFLNQTSGLPPTPVMTWLRAASQQGDPVAAAATAREAATTVPGGASGRDAAAEVERRAAAVDTYDGLVAYLNGNVTLLGEPGELFSYSNDGFCLLGGVVERVAGVPFDEFVTRRILEPLGMGRTTFDLQRVLDDQNRSTLYERDEAGRVRRSPAWQTTGRMLGGGMLKSTLSDLRTWVRFLMAPEREAPGGGSWAERLGVAAGLLAEMGAGDAWSGPGSRYGLGLRRVDDHRGLTVIGHGGGLKGVSSQIGWVPELGVGVVVLSNLAGLPVERILTMALNAYAGLPLEATTYEPRPYDAAAEQVGHILGSYASGEPYGRVRFYLGDDGALRAAVGEPAADVPAFMAGPDEVALRFPEFLAPVTILRRADGSVRGVHQGARVLERVG